MSRIGVGKGLEKEIVELGGRTTFIDIECSGFIL